MAVVLFDYRCFGGSEGLPRHWVSPRRHLQDWEAVVRHVQVGVAGAAVPVTCRLVDDDDGCCRYLPVGTLALRARHFSCTPCGRARSLHTAPLPTSKQRQA